MTDYRRETRILMRLAWPIVLTNVGSMLMGTVDTLMLGHWSREALAASVLANVWIHITQITVMGIVMGIDPIVTQAHGARNRTRLGLALQRGVVLALGLGVVLAVSRFFTADFLNLTQDDTQLAEAAQRYAVVQAPAAPFYCVFLVFRQYLQGRGILRPALIVTIAANLFNAAANGVLIYGLGWGLTGAGVATGLTQIALFLGLWFAIRRGRLLRAAWTPWSRKAFDLRGMLEVLAFGIPIGLHFALEVGAFGASSLVAGRLGETAIAAHGVTLNVASLAFMLPLGVSLAAVTRVGNLVGERRHLDAQRAAEIALGLGAGLMAICAIVIFTGRRVIPGFYTGDAAVIAACAAIFPVAAAFQIFDGIQVVGGGVLRGMGRTTPAALFNLVAWWVLALPLAWWLTFRMELGLAGVWWGLALGLATISVLFVAWIRLRGPASEAPPRRTSPG